MTIFAGCMSISALVGSAGQSPALRRAVASTVVSHYLTVGRVDDFPPGSMRTVRAGDRQIALARVGDEFYATQGACLHLKGPLGEGTLEGSVLTCPWHGWQYDVRTGKNEFDLALQLETYEVVVDDGHVKVAV